MCLRICPSTLGYLICWHIAVHSVLLQSFLFLQGSSEVPTVLPDFSNLSLFPFVFGQSSLSILFIFWRNRVLVSVILFIILTLSLFIVSYSNSISLTLEVGEGLFWFYSLLAGKTFSSSILFFKHKGICRVIPLCWNEWPPLGCPGHLDYLALNDFWDFTESKR